MFLNSFCEGIGFISAILGLFIARLESQYKLIYQIEEKRGDKKQ